MSDSTLKELWQQVAEKKSCEAKQKELTAHTTYIIQHFRINQKNLRIAPKIFLIIFYIEDMSYTIP